MVDAEALRQIEAGITDLVRSAGEIALRHFRLPLAVEFKRENRADPVTQADREVEEFLRAGIVERFPGHAILGEEGTEVDVEKNEFLWALDPVDGTTNFVAGLPLFGCSAGLLHRGEPVVGAMFLPVAPRPVRQPASVDGNGTGHLGGAVLHARLNGGAFLDGEPARASGEGAPEPSTLVGLPGHHARQFRRSGKLRGSPGELRSLGSVCYETAMVACGVFRYAVFRRPRLWDVAAGVTIVREAGGRALKWNGGGWEPLVRFEPMLPADRNGQPSMRNWAGTVLFGGDESAQFVAERLRPGRGMLSSVGEWISGRLINRLG